jgi:hypothetical protein
VIFERVALRPRHVTLHGLSTSAPKQTDLRSERSNEQTCKLEVLPHDALANLLNRRIRRYLHPAVFIQGLEANGRERRHIARALLGGGWS